MVYLDCELRQLVELALDLLGGVVEAQAQPGQRAEQGGAVDGGPV
ncbi:hypothetical protein [Frankia sp. CcWB2]